MKLIRPLLLFCLFCLTSSLSAQDLHWTLFNHSPLTLNPGFTGAYEGSFRVGGIARDQAPNTNHINSQGDDSNVFLSYNFYVDAPIITGFRKQDWVGIGVSFYSDEAGTLSLGQDYFQGSIAYHFGLDKKQKSIFTIGLHGGQGNRSFNGENAVFVDNLFDPTAGSSLLPGTPNPKHFELGAGLLFRSQVNKTTGFNIGLSFKHIVPAGQRAYRFVDSLAASLPLTLAFHTQLDIKMNKKWSITPALSVQNAGPATTAQLQGMLGYLFNEKKGVMLNFGLGYRFGDAAQLLLGMDYGAFRVAASFDLTLSSLAVINNNIGGFELGVSYIGRIYKDPAVKPVIFCPRF